MFEMALYRSLPPYMLEWTLIPIDNTFLSLCRQFVAFFELQQVSSIPFLRPLRGLPLLDRHSTSSSNVENFQWQDAVKMDSPNGGDDLQTNSKFDSNYKNLSVRRTYRRKTCYNCSLCYHH
jgi:hypothetical protein